MKMSSCKQTGYDFMEHNDDVIIVNVFSVDKNYIMYYMLVSPTGMNILVSRTISFIFLSYLFLLFNER